MAAKVDLIPHPSCAATPLRALAAHVRRERNRLRLAYRFEGDLAAVRVPPRISPASFVLGLWEHTCAEAFVAAAAAGTAYHELNFSPSGAWAALPFDEYRQLGAVGGDVATPHVAATVGDDYLELDVAVALDSLSPAYATAPLDVGLSAVVEALDGSLSYWSLFHPPGSADFHHPDARCLRLPAVQSPGEA